MKYCFLDTESGGLDKSTSLLSAAFILYDNFSYQSKLELNLVPDNKILVVQSSGLKVNGINLVEHGEKAITYKEGRQLLYDWLYHFKRDERIIPVGHGIYADLQRIWDNLLSRNSWDNFCSREFLDTQVIASFHKTTGKLPPDLSCSLSSLAKHFNIRTDDLLHTAYGDAFLTKEVFFHL